jgi:hypothetical protein
MTLFSRNMSRTATKQFLPSLIYPKLVLSLALLAPFGLNAADPGKTFATPEEAVMALAAAAASKDTNALRLLFGPGAVDLVNPDQVQASNDFVEFNTAFNQARRIVRTSDFQCRLYVGETSWSFPIPIVKKDGRWCFDVEAGKEELLNRRIGDNELSTLESVRAYVEAQREYAAKDRDGDEVLEYAQKITSSAGAKDGLYWPPELDGEISPLGPHAARAQAQGYFRRDPRSEGAPAEPFHGYFFKILTRQGKSAPGGKYDYITNGNMIGGFALVAWPAEYGNTGIMTFIVNQQGRVYQKDLGANTANTAAAIKSYDPDKTWAISPN